MAAIRTVKDLSTDSEFSGYYDIEEAHKRDLEYMRITAIEEKAIETAKTLLLIGVLTIEQIAEATKLSISDIEKLKISE